MHRVAEVVEADAPRGRVEQEHRRERRDSEVRDRAAREKRRNDVDVGFHTGRRGERVRADDRTALQQRVDRDRVRVLGGTLDPEVREHRELFAFGARGPDREAARRQAIALVARDGAKIARALVREELVEHVGPVDRRADAEARVAGLVVVALRRSGADLRPVVEQIAFEQHATSHAADDEVDVHRRVEDETRVEQIERERSILVCPDRRTSLVMNCAVLVIAQSAACILGRRRLDILLFRELLGSSDQDRPAERRRGPFLCLDARGRCNDRDRDAERICFARRHRAHTRKSRKRQARTVPTAPRRANGARASACARASLVRARRGSQGSSLNLGTVSWTSSEGGIGDRPMRIIGREILANIALLL